jgi:integrase
VFTAASGGFLEPRNINRAFHSLCTRADVPQLRVHDLRHSCATLLFTMGVPPATVQRILRHSSITVTTGTYVEVIEGVQRDALDSMGTLFEQVGGDSSRRLSSKKPRLSSRMSSNARKSDA